MFSKIFPKIHTEGYKFIVIAVFITIIFLIINNFLGLIGITYSSSFVPSNYRLENLLQRRTLLSLIGTVPTITFGFE